jgi:hypothetical protein
MTKKTRKNTKQQCGHLSLDDLRLLLQALTGKKATAGSSTAELFKDAPLLLRVAGEREWSGTHPVRNCAVAMSLIVDEMWGLDKEKGGFKEDESDERGVLHERIRYTNGVIGDTKFGEKICIGHIGDHVVYMVDKQAVACLRRVDRLTLNSQQIQPAKSAVLLTFLRTGNRQDKEIAERIAPSRLASNTRRLTKNLELAGIPAPAVAQLMAGKRPSNTDLFPEPALYHMPELPETGVLGRGKLRKDLRRRLGLLDKTFAPRVGIHGMGGVGKSTLIAEVILKNYEQLRILFPGGLFWIKVGGEC